MESPILLRVVGIPQTQGNKSPFVVKKKGGKPKAVMREGRSAEAFNRLKDWRTAVGEAARRWQDEFGDGLLTGPLVVSCDFRLIRPKSAPKRRRTWPTGRPDVEKLQRAVLDALKGVVYADDSQVVLSVESKDYGDPPGVEVRIWRVPEGAVAVNALVTIVGGEQLAVEGA